MEKNWMPMVAGILNIITGGISLLGGLLFILTAGIFLSASYSGFGEEYLQTYIIWVFFLPFFIIAVIAIVGGVYALRRKNWGLALAGSICAFLTTWAWPLGVAAIVFIALSRDAFDHN
jgi:hypothetical protein